MHAVCSRLACNLIINSNYEDFNCEYWFSSNNWGNRLKKRLYWLYRLPFNDRFSSIGHTGRIPKRSDDAHGGERQGVRLCEFLHLSTTKRQRRFLLIYATAISTPTSLTPDFPSKFSSSSEIRKVGIPVLVGTFSGDHEYECDFRISNQTFQD